MDGSLSATKALAKLNELTQRGQLKWKIVDPPDTRGSSDVVEIAYGTEFEGKRLRIFSRRSKIALDEDRFDWSEYPVLQIVDGGGRPLYGFPTVAGINDLLESVQHQVSGVGQLIEKLASGG